MTLVYPIIEESGEVHTPQSDYLIIAELLISAFLPASSYQLTYNQVQNSSKISQCLKNLVERLGVISR